ncbi:MAG: DUF3108 domain-containing protein [Ruegeria sp.]
MFSGSENSVYDLRALGVKVGEMTVGANVTASQYAVTARLATTGLAGTIRQVRFVIEARGRRNGARFQPASYVEDMDSGRKQSRARLTYSGGVARADGSQIGKKRKNAVTDAEQRGAVDPLTGIFMVLRDHKPDELCKLRQKIFDGERLTEIALTRRVDTGGSVQCSGAFTRVAGYGPDDLRKGSRFPVTVTYEPVGAVMRAVLVEAKTIYGAATVVRR